MSFAIQWKGSSTTGSGIKGALCVMLVSGSLLAFRAASAEVPYILIYSRPVETLEDSAGSFLSAKMACKGDIVSYLN